MAKVNIKSEKITPFGGIYYASFLWFSGKMLGEQKQKTSFYRCQCFAPVVSTVACLI